MKKLTPRQRHLIQELLIEEVRTLDAVLEYADDPDFNSTHVASDTKLREEIKDILALFLDAKEVTIGG